MVSPYLSRPLRSLREAFGSGQAPPRRRPDSASAPAARPEAANPLTSHLASPQAPRRLFAVVAGGSPGPARGNRGDRGGA